MNEEIIVLKKRTDHESTPTSEGLGRRHSTKHAALENLKSLIKLANHLDAKGLAKEADYLDGIIKMANPDEGNEDNIGFYLNLYPHEEAREQFNYARKMAAQEFTKVIYDDLVDFVKRRNDIKEINDESKYGLPLSSFESKMHAAISDLETDILAEIKDSARRRDERLIF